MQEQERPLWSWKWRRLHSEELQAMYSSPNIIRDIKRRRMGWAGYVACMEHRRHAYRVLVVRPEGKRTLGKPRCMEGKF